VHEFKSMRDILDLLSSTTCMQINLIKSNLLVSSIRDDALDQLGIQLPYSCKSIDEGLKYINFDLKPNAYLVDNWLWLFKKIKEKNYLWVHRLLSRGGCLVLLNSVLNNIPVYWASISKIPKGILTKTKKSCF
jgi:hypothetical protein